METFCKILVASMAMAATGLCAEPVNVSGIYPSLAYYNDEGECGTGAVAPWAGSLWVITYGPHCPTGSTDRLYQITPDLRQVVRPESVGGTHANRMIHRESQQLLIGTYLVDRDGKVRTVPIHTMPGRLTGVARHVTDPKSKIYVTDMEEALNELDVNTLETRTLIRDGFNRKAFDGLFARMGVPPPKGWTEAEDSDLFGYHGKGTCSGFGKVFYANNGWFCDEAMRNPAIPSGALASWRPGDSQWHLIRTNQFTDVTTPDGVFGNEHPDSNVIWALGWDAKSVILAVTTNGEHWVDYRLPKGSHSYDGAHGWNTEWPRIREIGDSATFLATMHGTFWKFPADFRPGHARGIRPRSNYLKVIGDFCQWNGRIVTGCDDSAQNEFMNKRSVKGKIQGPAKSHSNLRFMEETTIDAMGPAIGNAVVWRHEDVKAGTVSDPYLVGGYDQRWVWASDGDYEIEADCDGSGKWANAGGCGAGGQTLAFRAEWIRFRARRDVTNATVALCLRVNDSRPLAEGAKGRAIRLGVGEKALLHVNKINPKALSLSVDGKRGYQLDAELNLTDCPEAASAVATSAPLAQTVALREDAASIIYTDDHGNVFRLPRASAETPMSSGRICREVCTERDHFNAGGIYYELPAENAHGFFGVRPVCTHGLPIYDYTSWRGLFAMSLPGEVRLMAIDDMWGVGKAVGVGGPWKDTPVKAGVPSDPYLLNGFDRKTVKLSARRLAEANLATPVKFRIEVDVDGWGTWVKYRDVVLPPIQTTDMSLTLEIAFGGYWIRFIASEDCMATAQLVYK